MSNTLGENTRSKMKEPHGLQITRFCLITYIIMTKGSHRNMYAPHSTFLDYIPASFGSFTFCFYNG